MGLVFTAKQKRRNQVDDPAQNQLRFEFSVDHLLHRLRFWRHYYDEQMYTGYQRKGREKLQQIIPI
jgi:hypothetical protein